MAVAAFTRRSFYFNKFHFIRNYLTSSYLCENQWSSHVKEDNLINKVDSESLFTQLIQRYNSKLKVGAIDIDLYCHSVTTKDQLEELELLLTNFRKTPRAVDILDSTHHAVCRAYCTFNSHDRLLNIVEKRVDYGIFPDDYFYNALMDHWLVKGDVIKALRVAALYMLQENYTSEITRNLALQCAYKWLLRDPEVDAKEKEELESTLATNKDAEQQEEEDDDDEDDVKYIRVPFFRNAFHDGHFDLTDRNVICGKIMYLVGMKTSAPLSINMQVLGLALMNEWQKAENVLNNIDKNSKSIATNLVDLITSKVSKEGSEAEIAKLKDQLSSFTTCNSTIDSMLEDKLSQISKLEESDKETLIARMKLWQKDRQLALDAYLNDVTRDQVILEIRKKRKELQKREKLLYFFENLDSIEKELEEAEAELSKVKTGALVEEEYIPPTVSQSQLKSRSKTQI